MLSQVSGLPRLATSTKATPRAAEAAVKPEIELKLRRHLAAASQFGTRAERKRVIASLLSARLLQ